MATMLRLLQPVEESWKELARKLLGVNQQHQINTIESDCFHKDASHKALDDVFDLWCQSNRRAQRTWQILCDIVEEYNKGKIHNDESLEEYIKANNLKSKFQYITGLMKKTVLTATIYIHLYYIIQYS